MNKRLEKKIDKWLAERRKSEGGGWAAITDADINGLYEIIYSLVEAKCQKDADGDTPIQVKIIDRTRYESMHYRPIPYIHEAKTDDQQQDILLTLVGNLSTATDRVQDFLRFVNMMRVQKEAKAKK